MLIWKISTLEIISIHPSNLTWIVDISGKITSYIHFRFDIHSASANNCHEYLKKDEYIKSLPILTDTNHGWLLLIGMMCLTEKSMYRLWLINNQ